MPLDLSHDCNFTGPALPEPFVKLNLEGELNRLGILPKAVGMEGKNLEAIWTLYRRKLRNLIAHGGSLRVQNHVIEPLLGPLGYARIEVADEVETREGAESGGALLLTEDGVARLRVWCLDLDQDLDAPARRGLAYRFSQLRIAQRVLQATGERLGLLTNGFELRLVISDPARVDSQVTIALDPHWKRSRELPDSFRLLLALAKPAGVIALPEIIEKARLQQAKVTKDLREQARSAIREFIQEVLDHPENQARLSEFQDKATLAKNLWHEGLVTVYRLLFILKLETTDDPARSFSFSSSAIWRNTFSPTVALAPHVRAVLDRGAQTGKLLANGLRSLFRMFAEGLQCTELNVRPMAGGLFTAGATPILSALEWSEQAVAKLLDNLLWTKAGRGVASRERVHYGPLDVEDLGRVYEALLELEPGITNQPMCRLRRAKLEVVVPVSQGKKYRAKVESLAPSENDGQGEASHEDEETDEPAGDEEPGRGKKTRVEWIEEIPTDRFYLRVGLGRKSTGSFFTPHSFVRFLVHETIGPLVDRVSPLDDPQPGSILKIKVIDKAMGSGHFQVEACRFLGEKVYEAARRCDEIALAKERLAEAASLTAAERNVLLGQAAALRQRVVALPDPDDELLRYLPSRAPEGRETGFSQSKARALCRRMVAVHCLYGVDKNPLAVELAKLALWIECHAEGLPLTFLDHRLVVGDSLTGPFFEHLLKYPGSQQPLNDLFTRGLTTKLTAALAEALQHVHALEATVGATVADIEAKQAAKARLDDALAPFKILAAAWSGGVMLGSEGCDDTGYAALAKLITETSNLSDEWLLAISNRPSETLLRMVTKGLGLPVVLADVANIKSLLARLSANAIPALSFDLAFPEVFYPDGNTANRIGFDADLGNPPWDAIQFKSKEFLATFDLNVLEAPTKRERELTQNSLLSDESCRQLFDQYKEAFEETKRANDALYEFQKVEIDGDLAGRQLDAFRVFMERAHQVLRTSGRTGVVVPSAFHANAGATGIRRLYIQHMALKCCYSFENRRALFEIHRSFKFAAVVAEKGTATTEFPCAFYLHDDEWLFSERQSPPPLRYSARFVEQTGQSYLNFLELRSPQDFQIGEVCFNAASRLASVCSEAGIQLQGPPAALHMSHESSRFTDAAAVGNGGDIRALLPEATAGDTPFLALIEGKHFWHFDDRWSDGPRYALLLSRVSDLRAHLRRARYYQLAVRAVASSTNERTVVSTILPTGVAFGHSVFLNATPWEAKSADALTFVAVLDSFPFDWIARQLVGANVTLFVLRGLPWPSLAIAARLLAISALRLTCNHAGYAPLWREQLGKAWREAGAPFTWPVLSGDDTRWAVRAAIDAVVAHSYGLTRDQYAHVLSTFSHSSYKDAPRQCLVAFDELQQIGLEAFTKKQDPYWDIPLNENLPQPIIDLPTSAAADGHGSDSGSAEGPQALFEFQATPVPPPPGSFAQPSKRRRRGKANRSL